MKSLCLDFCFLFWAHLRLVYLHRAQSQTWSTWLDPEFWFRCHPGLPTAHTTWIDLTSSHLEFSLSLSRFPHPTMPQAPTYVSSSGQMSAPPLTKRVTDTLRDYATIGYLFVDTLVTVSRQGLVVVERVEASILPLVSICCLSCIQPPLLLDPLAMP